MSNDDFTLSKDRYWQIQDNICLPSPYRGLPFSHLCWKQRTYLRVVSPMETSPGDLRPIVPVAYDWNELERERLIVKLSAESSLVERISCFSPTRHKWISFRSIRRGNFYINPCSALQQCLRSVAHGNGLGNEIFQLSFQRVRHRYLKSGSKFSRNTEY